MLPARYHSIVKNIRKWQMQLSSLPDRELCAQAQQMRTGKTGGAGENRGSGKVRETGKIRADRERLFALIALAIQRTLGVEPYDEQLMGALAMSEGCAVQMQTGQGKTLTAVFPAMLYGLSGPAWIATANPYLARRDCEWMRPVYELLGFTVAVTEANMSPGEKQAAYACDILYGTHSEFGFDYLRDQLAIDVKGQVQRAPYFMLVDEADSILLDEAVTPMILSGGSKELDHNLLAVDRFVGWLKSVQIQSLDGEDDEAYERLEESADYIVIVRDRVAVLTALGQAHAEAFFRIDDLTAYPALYHLIYQAIQAHGVFRRDVDYIVRDGKLQIVDPHTGRVAEGRRYCNGLWQALEVKERLDVIKESRTVASISYQQYFRRFPHLAGMTGTAWEGRDEFQEIYRMKVRVIPPHQKCIRKMLPDVYAGDAQQQVEDLVQETVQAKKRGQPVLAVVRTVSDSEVLSAALKKAGIAHEVLNARDDAREAQIIARAGRAGNVTVATALAGRGTDIVLDENARAAGGLYVLGLGHQDTLRGDRQLAGRSGRQGDPGMCRFFISPEDTPIQRYAAKQPKGCRSCLRAVRRAQRTHEGIAQTQRKTTLKLDEAVGAFREAVYAARRDILSGTLPPEFARYPAAPAKAVLLATIDEEWADYLDAVEDARMGIGMVAMAGRDYEVSYIQEIAQMYEGMQEEVREKAHRRLAGMKDKSLQLSYFEG